VVTGEWECRLMGADEIKRRLGISRQRVQQLTNDPNFPEPCDVLAAGRVWLTADVEAWIAEHRPGRVRTDD
jgi:prophage regulatory protein